jgi:hypothetical protein
MDIFPPLTDFYCAIEADNRIGTSHISLYMALLQQWNVSGGINPIHVKRDEIMERAKILARHTYNKCMNDLNKYGYIIYESAPNGSVCSRVSLNERVKKQ